MATPAKLLARPNSESQRQDMPAENDEIHDDGPVMVNEATNNDHCDLHERNDAGPTMRHEGPGMSMLEEVAPTAKEDTAQTKPSLTIDTSVSNVYRETRSPVPVAKEEEEDSRPTTKTSSRINAHGRSMSEAITALERQSYDQDGCDSETESDGGQSEVDAIHNAHLSKRFSKILRVRSHNDIWAAENILLRHRRTPYVMRSVATSFPPGEDKDIFMMLADRVEDDMLEFAFSQNRKWQKLCNSKIAEAEVRIRAEITEHAQGQLSRMQNQFIKDTKAKNRVALDAITTKNWEAILAKVTEDPDHKRIEAEKAAALADKRWSQLMMHFISKQTEFLGILENDLRGLGLAKDMWELIEQSKRYTQHHVQMCKQNNAEAVETLVMEVVLGKVSVVKADANGMGSALK
ncbi:hypothetical protein K491DRAFT_738880 [Lophiostoma macrostomum CBS 122681]|uniref:Uncharacterized protein n=1 Tax=Lophiostoma macrostomum CBS 122681 TaxID=1314788 RepID=A0A6A6SMN0_9PLEO|nr:hypothetical protein K491DRAFT_738880 [Lophiostoma macrostomum CBS 122681]